jgi:hypothetical protein
MLWMISKAVCALARQPRGRIAAARVIGSLLDVAATRV